MKLHLKEWPKGKFEHGSLTSRCPSGFFITLYIVQRCTLHNQISAFFIREPSSLCRLLIHPRSSLMEPFNQKTGECDNIMADSNGLSTIILFHKCIDSLFPQNKEKIMFDNKIWHFKAIYVTYSEEKSIAQRFRLFPLQLLPLLLLNHDGCCFCRVTSTVSEFNCLIDSLKKPSYSLLML